MPAIIVRKLHQDGRFPGASGKQLHLWPTMSSGRTKQVKNGVRSKRKQEEIKESIWQDHKYHTSEEVLDIAYDVMRGVQWAKRQSVGILVPNQKLAKHIVKKSEEDPTGEVFYSLGEYVKNDGEGRNLDVIDREFYRLFCLASLVKEHESLRSTVVGTRLKDAREDINKYQVFMERSAKRKFLKPPGHLIELIHDDKRFDLLSLGNRLCDLRINLHRAILAAPVGVEESIGEGKDSYTVDRRMLEAVNNDVVCAIQDFEELRDVRLVSPRVILIQNADGVYIMTCNLRFYDFLSVVGMLAKNCANEYEKPNRLTEDTYISFLWSSELRTG